MGTSAWRQVGREEVWDVEQSEDEPVRGVNKIWSVKKLALSRQCCFSSHRITRNQVVFVNAFPRRPDTSETEEEVLVMQLIGGICEETSDIILSLSFHTHTYKRRH